MADRRPPVPAPGRAAAVAALVVVVIGIVGVAFRGSWGALRDAALTCHVDRTSAALYPFAVDGLMIVAIIAAVLLRHDRGARRYCLWIIGGYTVASWVMNFLHGLGWFSPNPVTHARPVPPWPVVVVVASLMIGSIFLGSHLVVYVWRHLWPDTAIESAAAPTFQAGTEEDEDASDDPEPPANNIEAAKLAYRHSLTPGMQRLSQKALMGQFGLTKRESGRVQAEVSHEIADEAAAAAAPEPDDVPAQPGLNGHAPASVGSDS